MKTSHRIVNLFTTVSPESGRTEIEADTYTKKDRPVFLARACFIGIPVGHFSHFLGPTKSFYSLLTVPLILLDSWWLLVWPKHPKNTFAACFRTFSGALVAWPTRKSESMRQKYFLDVLTHPVTLNFGRFSDSVVASKHPKNTFAACFLFDKHYFEI